MNHEETNGHDPDIYLYKSTTHIPAHPSGLDDLTSLYGLSALAASVARTDAQGNKILANKLNKTYKKQLLDLNVPGAPEIPKNKFIMGLIMAGLALAPSHDYSLPRDSILKDSFYVQPGKVPGYVKYVPLSPVSPQRRRDIITKGATNRDSMNGTEAESSDDGSRFKQLERERKKKMRMKREGDASYGDQKRRRYDNE